MLDESELLKQCEVNFGRGSGPGGQHRNKVETAVTIEHLPSNTKVTASERRHQAQNRHAAVFRLRMKLATDVRRQVDRNRHQPSDLWRSRRAGAKMAVNPGHSDYPALLAEALDVVIARDGDVAGAAGILGITMSQLAKLIRHDKRAFAMVNKERQSRGLPPLK